MRLSWTINALQVDHFGRKPFLLWGSVGMMCSLLGISAGFAISSPGLSFFACCTLVAAYALSFGPVTWLVTAEMFPAGIRGKALGVGQVWEAYWSQYEVICQNAWAIKLWHGTAVLRISHLQRTISNNFYCRLDHSLAIWLRRHSFWEFFTRREESSPSWSSP